MQGYFWNFSWRKRKVQGRVRGVTVRFGLVFSKKMSEPMKASSVWVGSVFTVFQKRN